MYSLNQFVNLLNTLASAHGQIKTFGEGDVWDIGSSGAVQYPLLWAVPQPSSTAQKLLNMKFSLIFADILDPDKSNEQDVLSDTLRIALDILAQLNNPDYSDDFILDANATLTPFSEKFDDDVAGWKADINIKINFLSDRCAVPSVLLPAIETPVCAPVIVKNSDGSYNISFDSGATALIPDSSITDSDGTGSSLPATKPFTAKNLQQLINAAAISVIYDELVAGAKLATLIPIFSGADLENLTSTQISLLTSMQILELSSAQIAGLSATQVQALTNVQIGYMSSGQVQELVSSQLSSLSVSQLQYILGTVMGNQFLQDNLSVAQRNSMNEIYTLQTGQTTSYAAGDDGSLQHGRLTDFFTLKTNNIFGNTHRFTDEGGNQAYPSNYVIDHATGLGWYRDEQTAATAWLSAINNANGFTLGSTIGILTNFYMPNMLEFLSIMNMENSSNAALSYIPFSIVGSSTGRWVSTSVSNPSTSAVKISTAVIPQITTAVKTTSAPYFIVRRHF